ncbi:MAG TPA: efflux RND transporter permease subunit [Steroidobacteraceae bacterium]|nr:efflux RND transporter permease subunit [Steroidobacteraceae bacterium]
MAKFFIDHPVFAWVLAILVTLGGLIALTRLPIEAYPSIAPPQVSVSANYPGANADTVEKTVTQVIEQQLTGLDHLLYFTSTSNSQGSCQITLTFAPGTNPDIAAVQTQARVQLAEPRLPAEVNQQGISVFKQSAGQVLVIALRSDDGRLNSFALNSILSSEIIDQIERVDGVASANQWGSEYAMRIWLDPDKLHAYGLSAAQVLATVQDQNLQVAAGSIGAMPSIPGQQLSLTVTTLGRFSAPEQFENIILRADTNGTTVRLKDVARVSLAPYSFGNDLRIDGAPIAGFGIQAFPGADVLRVQRAVIARMRELQSSLPPGVSWFSPFDQTQFITISIREVAFTLAGAVVLVFLTMLIFLQSFRATIIPTLVMPAALMGAFIGIYAVGFTINILSLFGVALAIGIVVDDAIVVIEAVERIMREEHLSPRAATRKAMEQITGAIVAITLVLAAVFVPSALQTGSVGAVYRQFALTIAISMLFSAFFALSFTPALCATLLRPTHLKPNLIFRGFNWAYETALAAYVRRVGWAVRHAPRWMVAFVVLLLLGTYLLVRLPGGFLPDEDQGYAYVIVQNPPGTTMTRTVDVLARVGKILHQNEAVSTVMQVAGWSFIGQGENVGLAFVRLKPWSERRIKADAFIRWANRTLGRSIRDAQVFAVNLPTVQALGNFGGFDFYLEDRAGLGHTALMQAESTLLAAAQKSPILTNLQLNSLADAPQLHLNVDRVQAESMGLSVSDVYTALQLMLAPVYANDFFYGGRVLRVLLQADAPYRMTPEALNHFYVPSTLPNGASGSTMTTATGTAVTGATTTAPDTFASSGSASSPTIPTMIPLSSVVHGTWDIAPTMLTRYNGYSAVEITGSNAPGYSSGQAMQEMQRLVGEDLPNGIGFDWAGQSLQEIVSGAQAPMLFGLSILVVYLALAALYESWAIPLAVMLVVPIGVLGAIVAAHLRGLPNDVFFKVGLITIIGLAAKNAILIVEFAVTEHASGKTLRDAVVEAARLRFRPILMTSFAFILGVMPLVVSSGAGANARHAIGTGVAGGMLSAALLGVLFVPVFYVVVRRLMGDPLDGPQRARGELPPAPVPAANE